MKALIIDGTNSKGSTRIETVEVEPTLEAFQALVGGNLETVMLNADAAVYFREDPTGLAENLPATLFVQAACAEDGRRLMGRIHGPLVVFGRGSSGEEADVPERELDRSHALQAICRIAP